jgi:HEAT repeat protein
VLYTLEEILSELQNPFSKYKTCFLANELGEYAKRGNDAAVAKLRELLAHEDEWVRYAAYAWLKELGLADAETVEALSVFEARLNNQPLVDFWKRNNVVN